MINILFVGFRHGHIESLYKECVENKDINIIGCIESDEKARNDVANRLSIEFSDTQYEEFLMRPDVDAVAVGDYYGARGDIILRAIQARKHVIADKPICTDLKTLKKIEKALSLNKVVFAEMLDLRYMKIAQEAKKIVSSGAIGEVKNISFTGQHCLNYGVRPSWYFEKGKHGGTINDLAIHGVDMVRMISGLEFKKVQAVRQWNSYAKEVREFLDSATFMASLSNGAGVLADVSYSAPKGDWMNLPTYWNFDIWCEKGMLNLSVSKDKLTLYKEGFTEGEIIIENGGAQELLIDDFVARIRGKEGLITNEEIIKSTRVALLLQSKR